MKIRNAVAELFKCSLNNLDYFFNYVNPETEFGEIVFQLEKTLPSDTYKCTHVSFMYYAEGHFQLEMIDDREPEIRKRITDEERGLWQRKFNSVEECLEEAKRWIK